MNALSLLYPVVFLSLWRSALSAGTAQQEDAKATIRGSTNNGQLNQQQHAMQKAKLLRQFLANKKKADSHKKGRHLENYGTNSNPFCHYPEVPPDSCTNSPGFSDSFGDPCEFYECYPSFCNGAFGGGESGESPLTACCICHDIAPPVGSPIGPPVDSPVGLPVGPPVSPPVGPPVGPPVSPPVGLPVVPAPVVSPVVPAPVVSTPFAGPVAINTLCLDPFVPPPDCSNSPGFLDIDSDGCDFFECNPSFCDDIFTNESGVSPLDACCVCSALQT